MNITVYLGASRGNDGKYAREAARLGRWIGENGHDLVYGGSRAGLMGIVADGVLEAGGKVYGVEPQMFMDAVVQHEGITRLFVEKDMPDRKARMIRMGDAFIAFPGGTGTLEEISEVISRNVLRLTEAPCIIYNLDHFYDHLEALLRHMEEEGFFARGGLRNVYFASGLEDIARILHSERKERQQDEYIDCK